MILFIKMSFFHYNIAKAIFAIILNMGKVKIRYTSFEIYRIFKLAYIS